MENFSENLKTIRKNKGFSQRKLAKIANTTQTTIAAYETRGRKPRIDMVKKLVEALDCTEAELLGYSDGADSKSSSLDNQTKNVATDTNILPHGANTTTITEYCNYQNNIIPAGAILTCVKKPDISAYNNKICAILKGGKPAIYKLAIVEDSAVLITNNRNSSTKTLRPLSALKILGQITHCTLSLE